MARKNNMKSDNPGTIHFDTRTRTVAMEVSQENIKEKVLAVREVVPGRSKNDVVMVLQYYDYNEERTIQAFLEDGAKEALNEWHCPNKSKSSQTRVVRPQPVPPAGAQSQEELAPADKAPSKKKNKKKGKGPGQAAASSASEAPSSNTASQLNGLQNGHLPSDLPVQATPQLSPLSTSSTSADSVPALSGQQNGSLPAQDNRPPSPVIALPPRSQHPKPGQGSSHRPGGSPPHGQDGSHPLTHSQSHPHTVGSGRQRTASERSTTSSASLEGRVKKPFAGLEKSIKDLQRQMTSLERLGGVYENEIDRAHKRIKSVFDEMRTALNEREGELLAELTRVKVQGHDVFTLRQEKAAELKVKVERADNFSESELSDLRAEIKHFVSDRKIDEELGRTTRFLYDSDHMIEEVKKFGEIPPIKCTYSMRRPSVASAASHEDHTPVNTPTPSSQTFAFPNGPAPTDSASADVTQSGSETNSVSVHEVAELQKRLKDSLRLQGLPVKSPTRNRSASAAANSGNQSGSQENTQHQGQGPAGLPLLADDDASKKPNRNQRRRQRQRDRQQEREPRPEAGSHDNQGAGDPSHSKPPASTPKTDPEASSPQTNRKDNPADSRGDNPLPPRGDNFRGRGRPRSPRKAGPNARPGEGENQQSRGESRGEGRGSRRGGRGRGGQGGGDRSNKATATVNGPGEQRGGSASSPPPPPSS